MNTFTTFSFSSRHVMYKAPFILFLIVGLCVASCRINLQAADPTKKAPTSGSDSAKAKKEDGNKPLRTIQDAITGEKKQQALGDGSIYAFKSLVGKKVKWQPADLTEGVWMPAGDTLFWLSSMSSFNATSSVPCPSGVEGGGSGECPKGNGCNGKDPVYSVGSPISLTFTNNSAQTEYRPGDTVNLTVTATDEDAWQAECQNPESTASSESGNEPDKVSTAFTSTSGEDGSALRSAMKKSKGVNALSSLASLGTFSPSTLEGSGSLSFTISNAITEDTTITLIATSTNPSSDPGYKKFPDLANVQTLLISVKKRDFTLNKDETEIPDGSKNPIGLQGHSSLCPDQSLTFTVDFTSPAASDATITLHGGIHIKSQATSSDNKTINLTIEGFSSSSPDLTGDDRYDSDITITLDGITKTYKFSVVRPKRILHTNDPSSPAVTGINVQMSDTSFPKGPTVPPPNGPLIGGKVVLATSYRHIVPIDIVDQYGQSVLESYNGAAVEEGFIVPPVGGWQNINAKLNGSSYIDPVGVTAYPVSTIYNVTIPAQKAIVDAWLIDTIRAGPLAQPPLTQSWNVRVGGLELEKGLERTQSCGTAYVNSSGAWVTDVTITTTILP